MPGITRVKTWVGREVLVYSDLNDEFDNIINNLEASNVDGYSASVAQMREAVDPGAVGSESLSLRISDELTRLRYAISRIVGKTYWYEAPSRSLQTTYVDADSYLQNSAYLTTGDINDAISESIFSGFYDSDGFNDANWLDSTNKKFSDTPFALKNDPSDSRYFFIDNAKTSARSSTVSLWFRNFAANDTIFFNPLSGLRLYLNSSGYIKLDQETASSVTNGTKVTYSITGTTSLAGSSSFINVIVRYKYGNATTDTVELLVNGVLIGTITGTALPINVPVCPNYKSVLFAKRQANTIANTLTFPTISGLPSANGWTVQSSGLATASTADGILTINGGSVGSEFWWYRTGLPALSANGQFIEMKFKLGANTAANNGSSTSGPLFASIHNNSAGKGVKCRIAHDEISLTKSAGRVSIDTTFGPSLVVAHNFTEWTHLFLVVNTTTTYLFINGEFKGSFSTPADTTAGNEVAFGFDGLSNVAPTINVEYVLTGEVATSNPDYFIENTNNIQQISDVCTIRGFLTDSATISSLQTSSPFLLFGKKGRTSNLVSNRSFWLSTTITNLSNADIGTISNFYSDGVTPVVINAMISCRPSAAGAGNFNIQAYLKIARTIDGNAQHVTHMVPTIGSLNSYNTLSNLGHAIAAVVPAATELQFDLPINTSMILPAGYYSVNAVVINQNSTAGSIIVNKAKCSVSS